VRQILAKTIIIFLALLIASILVAPSVNLDPAAPRLEWAACLLVIFIGWLAAMFAYAALLRANGPLVLPDCRSSGVWPVSDAPLLRDCSSCCCFRC